MVVSVWSRKCSLVSNPVAPYCMVRSSEKVVCVVGSAHILCVSFCGNAMETFFVRLVVFIVPTTVMVEFSRDWSSSFRTNIVNTSFPVVTLQFVRLNWNIVWFWVAVVACSVWLLL